MKKPIVAFMYDFDRTLCTKDMQEYSFIPELGVDAPSFWKEVAKVAENEKMDRIISYMYYMIKSAKAEGLPIRRKDFVELGKDVQLFAGVDTWFSRMNELGASLGLEIEHYIISSGLTEIIEGTAIHSEFKKSTPASSTMMRRVLPTGPPSRSITPIKPNFCFASTKGFYR